MTDAAADRPRKIPPHVPIGLVRRTIGLSVQEVVSRLQESGGTPVTAAVVSAIEAGTRPATPDLLAKLEAAYGTPRGSMTTSFVPNSTEVSGTAIPGLGSGHGRTESPDEDLMTDESLPGRPNALRSIETVCERTCLGRTFVYRCISAGLIRSVKVGRRRLVSDAAIDDFIEALETGRIVIGGVA